MKPPEKIYAKAHGASTEMFSGRLSLIGGWHEHERPDHHCYIRSDVATPTDRPFADALASLTSKEMTQARGDPDREADAVERLAHALGLAIAMAAGGDAKAIDTMIEGATAYAHEEAVSVAPLAEFAALVRRRRE